MRHALAWRQRVDGQRLGGTLSGLDVLPTIERLVMPPVDRIQLDKGDPRDGAATCPHCGQRFTFRKYHSGFGDEGFMYCDNDECVLTWSFYGPNRYRQIIPRLPWTLSDDDKRIVEASLKSCPFGGTFSFSNPPLCPVCFNDISAAVPGGIYYVVSGRRVDGDTDDIWT
jgi:hypothetical protein